jgi:hypothetical protein
VVYPAYGDASVSVAKRSYEQFVQEKIRKPSRLPEVKAKAAAVSAEMRQFLESRNCGTGSGGFQKGNSCGGGSSGSPAPDDVGAVSENTMGVGTAIGAALGGLAGAAFGGIGAGVGGAVGAYIGSAFDSSKSDARFEKASKSIGVSHEKIDAFARGIGTSLSLSVGKNGEIVGDTDNASGISLTIQKYDKSEVGPGLAGKMAFVKNYGSAVGGKGTESSGRFAETLAREGKKLGVDHVGVSIDATDKAAISAFRKAGFDSSIKADDGSKVTVFKSYKTSRRSYDELSAFLAERRDCGRDESGKFGSGNKCQDDEGSPAGASNSGEKSKYMEWKKGDHLKKDKPEKTQEFLDDAREGQLARGGKDGGKSDDGGGVQTWSKGDDYPWTTQQVGTDEGYLQARHPDGSKTGKYPFSKGDTSAASEALKNELKKKKKSRASDVAEETLRFLRERTRM